MTTAADASPTPGQRLHRALAWLLGTDEGLVTTIFFGIMGIICLLGTFSEPMVILLGKPLIPIELNEAEKVGRVVMLYHALGVPFLASVVLLVLKYCDVRPALVPHIRWTVFIGAVVVAISGITFAYLSRLDFAGLGDAMANVRWVAHGLFLMGLSLVFYGGVLLLVAIWPTTGFPDPARHIGKPYLGRINLEQLNLTLVTIALLVSVVIGAIPGSYFGNGFDAMLAEAVVREEHDVFQRMVVSHLHIMVALLDAAVMLLVFRYANLSGRWFHIALLASIPGIIIMSVGAWLVITGWEKAHMVINMGANFLLIAAVILTILGWKRTLVDRLGDDYAATPFGSKVRTLLEDPIRFGLYLQFTLVNFVVSIPGIWVAVHLDEFREGNAASEYAFNVGHWHVLVTLTAVIIFLLLMDILDLRGRLRKVVGWTVVIGSAIAFIFANVYMLTYAPNGDNKLSFMVVDLGLVIAFVGFFTYIFHQLAVLWHGPPTGGRRT